MNKARIFTTPFASVYPLYIQKAEKKGRTNADVDAIIFWLTGYSKQTLQQQIDKKNDFETFFAQARQVSQPQIVVAKMAETELWLFSLPSSSGKIWL